MKRKFWILFSVIITGTSASAQQNYAQQNIAQPDYAQQNFTQPGYAQPGYVQQNYAQPGYAQSDFAQQGIPQGGYVEGGGEFAGDEGQFFGAGSIGSSEQLFTYDDQETWKHGYLKIMPYYHGFHSFRPYNYHHVFSQSTTAQGFGMSPVMPYSQQFWHRYERMADLSQGNHEPVFPSVPPVEKDDHLPKPINEAALPGQPSAQLMPPYRNSQANGMDYQTAPRQPRNQNFSQLFQPVRQSAPVAPARYQNSNPYQNFSQAVPNSGSLQGPSLPAPNFQR